MKRKPDDKTLQTENPALFVTHSKLIQVFQLRLVEWNSQGNNNLNLLFDDNFTLNTLKENIRNFDELMHILTLPSLNPQLRYNLFSLLISTLPVPKDKNLNTHTCDNEFLERCTPNTISFNKVLSCIPDTPLKTFSLALTQRVILFSDVYDKMNVQPQVFIPSPVYIQNQTNVTMPKPNYQPNVNTPPLGQMRNPFPLPSPQSERLLAPISLTSNISPRPALQNAPCIAKASNAIVTPVDHALPSYITLPSLTNQALDTPQPLTKEKKLEYLKTIQDRINWAKKKELSSIKYYDGTIFDQKFTVNNLKDSIENLQDFTEILKNKKLDKKCKYTLCSYLISRFHLPPNDNYFLTGVACDDIFLTKIVKSYQDVVTISELIGASQTKPYSTILLNRLKKHSPYVSKMLPVMPQNTIATKDQQHMFPSNPQKALLVTGNENPKSIEIDAGVPQPSDTLVKFTSMIKFISGDSFKNDIKTLFESPDDIRNAIQNLNDLAYMLNHSQLNIGNKYSLFSYLISDFPLPKNNGNLVHHGCDDIFLAKIIKNSRDLHIITDELIGRLPSMAYNETLIRRMTSRSRYIKQMLIEEKSFNKPHSFFNMQKTTVPKENTLEEIDAPIFTAIVQSEPDNFIRPMKKRKLMSDKMDLAPEKDLASQSIISENEQCPSFESLHSTVQLSADKFRLFYPLVTASKEQLAKLDEEEMEIDNTLNQMG